MPVYYFHLIEDGERMLDREGRDFPSLEMAREEAVKAARDIMAEGLKQGEPLDGQIIEVADETGSVLFSLPFKEAIPQ